MRYMFNNFTVAKYFWSKVYNTCDIILSASFNFFDGLPFFTSRERSLTIKAAYFNSVCYDAAHFLQLFSSLTWPAPFSLRPVLSFLCSPSFEMYGTPAPFWQVPFPLCLQPFQLCAKNSSLFPPIFSPSPVLSPLRLIISLLLLTPYFLWS